MRTTAGDAYRYNSSGAIGPFLSSAGSASCGGTIGVGGGAGGAKVGWLARARAGVNRPWEMTTATATPNTATHPAAASAPPHRRERPPVGVGPAFIGADSPLVGTGPAFVGAGPA